MFHCMPNVIVTMKNIARSRKAALRNLIGFGGVKLFLLKNVTNTTVTTAIVTNVTHTTVTITTVTVSTNTTVTITTVTIVTITTVLSCVIISVLSHIEFVSFVTI